MKVCLDVTTNKRLISPTKDSLILYDGQKWYITTKHDVFNEYEAKMEEKLAEISEELENIKKFKAEIATQIADLSDMVGALLSIKGE